MTSNQEIYKNLSASGPFQGNDQNNLYGNMNIFFPNNDSNFLRRPRQFSEDFQSKSDAAHN